MQINEDNIDPAALQEVFDIVSKVLMDGGGKVKLTTLLAILNFPSDVTTRIQTSRGDVDVKGITPERGIARNVGKQISEKVPGMESSVSLVVKHNFECELIIDRNTKTLKIDKLKGLTADGPLFFDFDLDAITIKLPRYIDLNL